MRERKLVIVSLARLLRAWLGPLDLEEVSRLIWNASNAERSRRRLRLLERHVGLDRVAASHSRDMALRGYFDHCNPDGNNAFNRVELGCPGLAAEGVGENIAQLTMDGNASWIATQLMGLWMDSPGHQANILDSSWTHLGVGLWRRSSCVWATQVFARLAAELQGPAPRRIRHGAEVHLRARVYPAWQCPDEVQAIVRVPDPRLHIAHSDGGYGAGWYPAR